ncbi:MAG: hypothetical protein EOM20_11310 [Spartobacteria bacterium]|nr:hypothetical protein [Spartobacteria bacterium]
MRRSTWAGVADSGVSRFIWCMCDCYAWKEDEMTCERILCCVLTGVVCVLMGAGCVCPPVEKKTVEEFPAGPETPAPSVVRLIKTEAGYHLERNGARYDLKGAGGREHLDQLVAAGGNSIRTWDAKNKRALLDRAHELGLTVTIGIWLGHERHGFDYTDHEAVEKQWAHVRRMVEQYKDHPALLIWAVGNEGEGDGTNPEVWKAINAAAQAVKELDPNHPVMTVTSGLDPTKVAAIRAYCPALDIIGPNCYEGVAGLIQMYREEGGVMPLIICEFGPRGQWAVDKTAWGAPIEPTSTEKAEMYRDAYRDSVEENADICLGSYAFLWGEKQEATATWFGMFLRDGARLAAVEAMADAWGGAAPTNRCPQIAVLKVSRTDGLAPGETITATVDVTDPDGDPLEIKWMLRRESGQYMTGGDRQNRQPEFPDAIVKAEGPSVEVKMPEKKQGYRLFAYVYDGNGNAAVANQPLLVEDAYTYPEGERVTLPLAVYADNQPFDPFVASGYMGAAEHILMNPTCVTEPHSGKYCMEIIFDSKTGWGGVVWQSPANDWGEKPGGYDISGARIFSFWARGKEGGETVSFGMGILKRDKDYPDSALKKLKDVRLTKEWRQYTIPLEGENLSHIKTGFYWVGGGSGKPMTFYVDDIVFE